LSRDDIHLCIEIANAPRLRRVRPRSEALTLWVDSNSNQSDS